MTTPISQPAVQLEEKTINALNRLAISKTDGKWPSQNRERRTVRFASESPNRSRSQTPENRRRYNTPTPYREDQIGEIKSNTNLEDVTYATRKVTWQDSAGGQNKAHSHNKMPVKTDNKRTDEINLA
jgi:hypothetical protein